MNRRQLLTLLGAGGLGAAALATAGVLPAVRQARTWETRSMKSSSAGLLHPLPQSEAGWKRILTPEQHRILRRKGTECAIHVYYVSAVDS